MTTINIYEADNKNINEALKNKNENLHQNEINYELLKKSNKSNILDKNDKDRYYPPLKP